MGNPPNMAEYLSKFIVIHSGVWDLDWLDTSIYVLNTVQCTWCFESRWNHLDRWFPLNVTWITWTSFMCWFATTSSVQISWSPVWIPSIQWHLIWQIWSNIQKNEIHTKSVDLTATSYKYIYIYRSYMILPTSVFHYQRVFALAGDDLGRFLGFFASETSQHSQGGPVSREEVAATSPTKMMNQKRCPKLVSYFVSWIFRFFCWKKNINRIMQGLEMKMNRIAGMEKDQRSTVTTWPFSPPNKKKHGTHKKHI